MYRAAMNAGEKRARTRSENNGIRDCITENKYEERVMVIQLLHITSGKLDADWSVTIFQGHK